MLRVNLTKITYKGWNNLLKVFRYLKANKNYGLKFTKDTTLNVYVMQIIEEIRKQEDLLLVF